jgi:uncharacterized membrane protein YfcA
MDSLDAGTIAVLIGSLAVAGFATGILSGLFGVGGGGILVPVLFELFSVFGVPLDHRMHLAVGTSLAIIIPTSIQAFRNQHAKGAVDIGVLAAMGPAVVVGVLAGIYVAAVSPSFVLTLVFIVSAVVMSFRLVLGADRLKLGDELPSLPVQRALGVVVGIISTLIGIGGGIYISSFMMLYGRPIHQALATASGFGPLIAIPAAIGYAWAGYGAPGLPFGSLGHVNIPAALLIVPASVYAAPIGVRIAHGLSRRTLELAFAAFLITMAMRFLFTL